MAGRRHYLAIERVLSVLQSASLRSPTVATHAPLVRLSVPASRTWRRPYLGRLHCGPLFRTSDCRPRRPLASSDSSPKSITAGMVRYLGSVARWSTLRACAMPYASCSAAWPQPARRRRSDGGVTTRRTSVLLSTSSRGVRLSWSDPGFRQPRVIGGRRQPPPVPDLGIRDTIQDGDYKEGDP